MALYELEEFCPNYQDQLFDGDDIKGLDVYVGRTGEKIGVIDDALVDEQGRFRYFVIDTGFWIFGKKVLLPVGYCQIDDRAQRIYATGILSKKQVEELPEYHGSTRVNRAYEEGVRNLYQEANRHEAQPMVPIELPTHSVQGATSAQANSASYDRANYNYQQDPSAYNLNERAHRTLKLHEERLVANKKRHQTGEVVVGKHIETETSKVSLPVVKERVVIDRTTPVNAETVTSPGKIDFSEGEVARMKVYEETADIHKEAFVREEVRIRKEVTHDTVEATETLRREELDIDA